jgi:hypothetical protein
MSSCCFWRHEQDGQGLASRATLSSLLRLSCATSRPPRQESLGWLPNSRSPSTSSSSYQLPAKCTPGGLRPTSVVTGEGLALLINQSADMQDVCTTSPPRQPGRLPENPVTKSGRISEPSSSNSSPNPHPHHLQTFIIS